MSQLQPDQVFKGFWVNHAEGPVLGSTITTSSNTANIIVAVLSLLLALTGKQLWHILAVVSIQALSPAADANIVYREQLQLLKRVKEPASVFVRLLRMRRRWRQISPTKKLISRIDLLNIAAALCSVGFVVAGVLSSLVITSENIDVLAYSTSCGFTGNYGPDIVPYQYHRRVVQETIEYVHRCYNGSRSDSGCQIHMTQAIPFSTEYVDCPFEDMCELATDQALKLDTGLLWTDDIFGLNLGRKDALALRQVTRCAPLNVTRYERVLPIDEAHAQQLYSRKPLADEYMVTLSMGAVRGLAYNNTITTTSTTLNTSATQNIYMEFWCEDAETPFQQSPWYIGTTLNPIEPLQSAQSDLTLLALAANNLQYSSPVDDPFFSAHRPRPFRLTTSTYDKNETFYGADKMLSVMACTQQYEFCSQKDKCTGLKNAMPSFSQIADMDLTPLQNVTLYSIANAIINHSSGFNILASAGVPPLLANDGGDRSHTHGVPPNQWELEVKYWTAIILAMIQRLMADFVAAKDQSLDYSKNHYSMPAGPTEIGLCHAQKMKAPSGISNVSVFGMSFVVSVCGAIILANLVSMKIIRFVSESKKIHLNDSRPAKQGESPLSQNWMKENGFSDMLDFQRGKFSKTLGIGIQSVS